MVKPSHAKFFTSKGDILLLEEAMQTIYSALGAEFGFV